jgi:hypothetical protein
MKPLLLGMNNPLSDDPEYDLYPYPEGSTGWRLWKMLPEGTTRRQYLDAFDRANLLHARGWDARAARAAARLLMPSLAGRFVVVLGTEVRAALGLPLAEPLSICRTVGMGIMGAIEYDLEWLAFPHPSGRNRWFNQAENRAAAVRVLTDLALGGAPRSLSCRESVA